MISLSVLRRQIISCARCARLRAYCARVASERKAAYRDDTYWGRPVPGFGDPRARLLVVGLAPAAHGANRTGRMFTGDSSGDFLMRALRKTGFANRPASRRRGDGLVLDGAYISAAARCAPPGNTPTRPELDNCRPFLAAEMRALTRMAVVVALGRVAFDAVLRVLGDAGAPLHPRPRFGHARLFDFGKEWPTVIASYHPSRQNTNTGRLTEPMFDEVFLLARLRARRLTRAQRPG